MILEAAERLAIIHVAWGEIEGDHFTMMVDDRMQLEAEKPAHCCFATFSEAVENTVLRDTLVVTHFQRRAIDERDTCTVPLTKV